MMLSSCAMTMIGRLVGVYRWPSIHALSRARKVSYVKSGYITVQVAGDFAEQHTLFHVEDIFPSI